ncbi:MAG: hypothetical protein ACK6CU_05890 [Deltaproteobacteria bacterium]|jgi:hypothetical protein
MDPRFAALIESLEPKRRALLEMTPVTFGRLPREIPARGIYLFSEGDEHLYVGRTNGIKTRLANHCRAGSTHNMATFAFRLARKETNRLKATYKAEGSRSSLLEDPAFAGAFVRAKARAAACDIRYVREDDPTNQALLEICVATVLQTPYNDFENH